MARPQSVDSDGCPVCLEEFCEPKLLPCAHVVCRSCTLSWLRKGHQGCPLCQTPILTQAALQHGLGSGHELTSAVDELPTDQITSDQARSKRVLTPPHACHICEDHSPAVSFCFQCNFKLCSSCAKGHHKIPATRDHDVRALVSLTTDVFMALTRTVCTSHADRTADLYCADHHAAICTLCASTLPHRLCRNVDAMELLAKRERARLEERLCRLREKEKEMEKAIKSLDEAKATACARSADIQKDINEKFDRMAQAVEARRKILLHNVQTSERNATSRVTLEKSKLEIQRAVLAEHILFGDRLVAKATDGGVMKVVHQLEARLKKLEMDKCKRLAEICLEAVNFDQVTFSSIQRAVAELGHLTSFNLASPDHEPLLSASNSEQSVDLPMPPAISASYMSLLASRQHTAAQICNSTSAPVGHSGTATAPLLTVTSAAVNYPGTTAPLTYTGTGAPAAQSKSSITLSFDVGAVAPSYDMGTVTSLYCMGTVAPSNNERAETPTHKKPTAATANITTASAPQNTDINTLLGTTIRAHTLAVITPFSTLKACSNTLPLPASTSADSTQTVTKNPASPIRKDLKVEALPDNQAETIHPLLVQNSVRAQMSPLAVPSVITSTLPLVLTSTVPSLITSTFPLVLTSTVPSLITSTLPLVLTSTVPSLITSTLPLVLTSTVPSLITSTLPLVLTSTVPSLITSTLPLVLTSTVPSLITSTAPTVRTSTLPFVITSTLPSLITSTTSSVITSTVPPLITSTAPSVRTSSVPSVRASTVPIVITSTTASVVTSTAASVFTTTVPSLITSTAPSVRTSTLLSVRASTVPFVITSTTASVVTSTAASIITATAASGRTSSVPSVRASTVPFVITSTTASVITSTAALVITATAAPGRTSSVPSVRASTVPFVITSTTASVVTSTAASIITATAASGRTSSVPSVRASTVPFVITSTTASVVTSTAASVFTTTVPSLITSTAPSVRTSTLLSVRASTVPFVITSTTASVVTNTAASVITATAGSGRTSTTASFITSISSRSQLSPFAPCFMPAAYHGQRLDPERGTPALRYSSAELMALSHGHVHHPDCQLCERLRALRIHNDRPAMGCVENVCRSQLQ